MKPSIPSGQIVVLLDQACTWHRQGRLQEAQEMYRQVLSADPGNFEALDGMGVLCGQLGRFDEALQYITQARDLKPNDFAVHYNRGTALNGLKRYEEALASYDQAITLKPDFADAYNNRGNTLKNLGRYEEALASYDKAIVLRPDYAAAYNHRAVTLEILGRYAEAMTNCDKALSFIPNYTEAHINRGYILSRLQRYDEAIACYDRALKLNPDSAEAHNNKGNALRDLRRYQEALASYDLAIALKPDYAEAYNNRGLVLLDLGCYQDALTSCDRAIALKPDFAEAYNVRGAVLHGLNRYQDALASYDRAIALKHDFADALYNKSLIKLLLGDYQEGWSLYEWRWKAVKKDHVRNFKQALWLGDQSVAGKTILLHAEQGFGDVILSVRYVPMVEALGGKVILEVPIALAPLMATLTGAAAIVVRGDALPDFDLHCPLMSLPLAFKTTVASIPAQVPYLGADAQRRSKWHTRLGTKVRPRVGLVWSGNIDYKNDHNRSIALRNLENLLSLEIEYHSLQKEVRPGDKSALVEFKGIHSHERELHDFVDTAALIAELDLVITIDTSVAHLAGALGIPVWILLPHTPDYRWMLDRSDSPWYPSARLIRQQVPGDWTGVLAQVHSELNQFIVGGQNSDP